MINVIGDEITFDGITIGKLAGGWPTLVERAVSVLQGAEPGMVSEKDHQEACDEARREGRADAEEDARAELRDERAAIEEKGFNAGYDKGRADVIRDMAQAADAERVELLLQAISQAHDNLEKIARQRFPAAKLGELKKQAIASCSTIRLAVNRFRAD